MTTKSAASKPYGHASEIGRSDFDSAWEAGEDGMIDNDIPVRYIPSDDLIK
jgi:hypothetical protein